MAQTTKPVVLDETAKETNGKLDELIEALKNGSNTDLSIEDGMLCQSYNTDEEEIEGAETKDPIVLNSTARESLTILARIAKAIEDKTQQLTDTLKEKIRAWLFSDLVTDSLTVNTKGQSIADSKAVSELNNKLSNKITAYNQNNVKPNLLALYSNDSKWWLQVNWQSGSTNFTSYIPLVSGDGTGRADFPTLATSQELKWEWVAEIKKGDAPLYFTNVPSFNELMLCSYGDGKASVMTINKRYINVLSTSGLEFANGNHNFMISNGGIWIKSDENTSSVVVYRR